jgi:RAD51-like protein 1
MGEEATVLYLDTEGAFAPARLAEMLSALEVPMDSIAPCVSRIKMIGRIASIEDFDMILKDLESTVAANDVKLIVVDSIAALVRKDFDLTSIALRQGKLSNIASQLKRLAEAFQIPIIIVNQVTTQFVDGPGSDRSFVTAALGTSWSHSVNTRLVIEPTTGKSDFGLKPQMQDVSLRRLTLAKSPTAPVVMMAVHIWAGGLKMVPHPDYSPRPARDDAMQVDDEEEQVDEDIFEKYLIAMDPANFWTHGIASTTTHTAMN